jgi:hypothetical protein
MKINFKYSYILDLVYHIFAHIKVDNASDLYDIVYINTDLVKLLHDMEKYYNSHFHRLMIIQFILNNSDSINEVSNILLTHPQFTNADIQYFIVPFINILRIEDRSYRRYWDKVDNENLLDKARIETEISEKFSELEWLFNKYEKEINIYLSYSITRNGRGILSAYKYQAVTPYPLHLSDSFDINHCFYMAFHEITHQITDSLVNSHINMNDGSHDLSEKIAVLADYYWLNDKPAYLKWISQLFGFNEIITTEQFEKIFKAPEAINDKILQECINK